MGVDIDFAPGLVVLRADNSTGKSTSLQAIVFALGLEGMFGPTHAIPLPHAMTHRVTDPETGAEVPVLESEVLLEVENAEGRVATIRRHPRHPDVNPNLISVFESPGLTHEDWGERRDYFIRLPGAAQRERGFHRWLADFLGWDLPDVPRFNGPPAPLYLETIFPLFVVEQKRGWSGVLSRVPTHFQIRDAARRALEFILGLQASELALERQRVEAEAQRLSGEWKATTERATAAAQEVGGVVQSLPSAPVASWPPSAAPTIVVPFGDGWEPIEREVVQLQEVLHELRAVEVPSAEEAAPQVGERLQQLTEDFRATGQLFDALQRELDLDQEELASLRKRHDHLSEELRRTQDARLLHRLGSPLQDWIELDDCPTCHQKLAEALLPTGAGLELIPLDEAESRTRQQLDLVAALERDLTTAFSAKKLKADAVETRLHELERSIRVAKQTLISPSQTPSRAHVHQEVEAEHRLARLTATMEALKRVAEALSPLSEQWTAIQTNLQSLRDLDISSRDEARLKRLGELLVGQLKDYGFRSLPADEISISLERYTPTHDGFDLGFDLSASDMIRLIWAYVLGLLELAREYDTHHPGLLLLDEPRQQSTDPVAFRTLLHRAAKAGVAGQQVLFATSEPDAAVREMLRGTDHSYLSYEGFMLRRR